mmetsp:Transcript_41240/g.118621  ORF Transcript_41240/g.118621 Transcript_41240/m.118621 type:complete len:224 (+) Transcript_41240:182-853(+)
MGACRRRCCSPISMRRSRIRAMRIRATRRQLRRGSPRRSPRRRPVHVAAPTPAAPRPLPQRASWNSTITISAALSTTTPGPVRPRATQKSRRGSTSQRSTRMAMYRPRALVIGLRRRAPLARMLPVPAPAPGAATPKTAPPAANLWPVARPPEMRTRLRPRILKTSRLHMPMLWILTMRTSWNPMRRTGCPSPLSAPRPRTSSPVWCALPSPRGNWPCLTATH